MTLIDPLDRETRTALAPDLSTLPARAARAWTERMAVRSLEGARYAVVGQSGRRYVVDIAAGTCTCPDHRIRGERCKHLRRVAIAITAHRVPPPGRTWAVCDACGTETFVPEGAPEPHLCSACRLDSGEVVLDRETGDRLVVVAVTDRRADDYDIDAVDSTVAAYPGNDGYPADDLVVEAAYLTDAARANATAGSGTDAGVPPRTYAFPRSRLRRTDDAALVA